MAHNNAAQLNLFLKQILNYEYAEIFIHIDAKGVAIIPDIMKDKRIHVLQEHIWGNWGDYTLIEMTDKLLRAAADYGEYDYFTLHSGSDLAVKPVNELASYLRKTHKYFYCGFNKLPVEKWGHGGGLERLVLRYPKWLRKRLSARHPFRYLRSIYQRLFEHKVIKGKKLPEKYTFYGGQQWFTISKECFEDYLRFKDENPEYDKIFRLAMIPDEIYYNSIFEMTRNGREAEAHNTLMYVDWEQRGGRTLVGSPNTITMDHIDAIEDSGEFFARKFDATIDSDVIKYFCDKI